MGIGLLTVIGIAGVSVATEENGTASSAGTASNANTARTLAADSGRRDEVFELVEAANIPGLDGFSVGIDPVADRIGVSLFVPKGLPDAVTGTLKLGDDVTVTVEKSTAPQPNIDVSGGAGIGNVGFAGCTAGFPVGLANGKSGFVTAGHCFDAATPVTQQTVRIGSVAATGFEFNYGPSDHGVYSLDNSTDTDRVLPQVIADDGAHPVKGITPPTVGMDVCKHGITTGTTCGKVTLLNTRVTYAQVTDETGRLIRPSTQINNVIQSNLCTEPGDSGGPVFTQPAAGSNTPVNAVAVHSGGLTVKQNGKSVCGEKVGSTNIAYHVPLSDTPAKSTNPFDDVFLKVSS
ncbi:S1 family peptidase [Streptomyces sp. MA5143a]|uniref:S1 family peptidase n=1 Tax=Streptomyces sp. MA5143a TaxID=2083010 RepID=UPI0015E64791|nr:S1 family peptidase [Streptomyces sp. MA5143a]